MSAAVNGTSGVSTLGNGNAASMAGKAKTNFGTDQTRKQPWKPVNSKVHKQKVAEAPADIKMDEYVVDPSTIVCFSGTDHFLSTMYTPASIRIDDNDYISVEHYYQACKLFSLAGPEYALQLANIKEPIKVKIAARTILRSLNVSSVRVEEWKMTDGFHILNHAIGYKFGQHPELKKKLLETGNGILAQSHERDTFYACGLDNDQMEKWATDNEGKVIKIPSEMSIENMKYIPLVGSGRNILGAVCMKIRKQLMGKKTGADSLMPPDMDLLSLSTKQGGFF